MTKRKRKRSPVEEIASFRAWVSERGGEVLVTTNEWELVRFRGDGVTSIIYTSKVGRRSYSGRAQAAWDAFQNNDSSFRLQTKPPGLSQKQRKRLPIIRTLIERDGNRCFYCDAEFNDVLAPTREHLVPATAGGPDHISNLFLACDPCNRQVGHLSAPEKIRFRDMNRRGRGSKLLARTWDRLFGGEGDPTLLDDIKDFLHLNDNRETAR